MSDLPEGFTLDAAPPPGFKLDAAPAPAASPSLWKRATINAREGFDNTSTGEVVNYNQSGQANADRATNLQRAIVEAEAAKSPVGLEVYGARTGGPAEVSPHGGIPVDMLRKMLAEEVAKGSANKAAYEKKREANAAEAAALPSWTAEPSLFGKAIAGATALAGQMIGGLPAVENLVGGAGPKIVRGAGEGAVSHIARNIGAGAAENAAAATVANPTVQMGKVARGEQEEFDPAQVVESAAMGGGIGGALRAFGMGARGAARMLRREAPVAKAAPEVAPPEPELLQLPAPGRAHLTDEEIALLRAANERGNRPVVETPPKIYGSEERAPQTSTDLASQDQAREAFTLAQAQRERAGPTAADTQPAARPEGAGQSPVHLDEGHPVDILNRRLVPDEKGRMTEVATVRRYDPRTGEHDPAGVEYDVPVKQLQTKGYAKDPRQAQDFVDRAEGPPAAELPRQPGRGAPEREQAQTYRTTAPDDNAAGTARASRPEQPEGPHPGSPWSSAEEAVRHFRERQARGESEAPPSGKQYEGAKSTNKARPVDRDGRFVVDENGHVMSTGEAPIRFKDQMQAGKWIIGVGQKQSPDQVFEIANHPNGGFSVRERGRSATPDAASEAPAAGPQRQLGGPAVDHGDFNQKIAEARDRVLQDHQAANPDRRTSWHRESENRRQTINETARYEVMHDEARASIDEMKAGGHLNAEDIGEISQHYTRLANETPTQAFERATDRWFDAKERDALRHDPELEAALNEAFPLEGAARGPSTRYVPAGRNAAHIEYDPGNAGRPIHVEPPVEEIPFDVSERQSEVPRRPVPDDGGPSGRQGEGEPGASGGRGDQGAGDGNAAHGSGGGRDFPSEPERDGWRQTVVPGAERVAPREGVREPIKGSEPPPKGGLFDEDARNQTDIFDGSKFSANPFADPKMWAWAAKSPGLFSDTWKAGVADLFDSVRQARSQKSDAVKTAAIADLGRGIFRSMDKEWRILAKRYDSRTMDDIRTMFHAVPDVGRGGAVETTYHEAILEHGQGNLNKVADIFKPLISTVGSFTKLTVGRDKTALNQVVKLVENPRNIRAGSPIHDAAAALRKLLDDNHKYLKDAGVEIGKIDGYFPHMLKSDEVRRNPDLFVSMAAREMLANKATSGVANLAEATKRAEAWRDHVMLMDAGVKEGGTDFIKLGHMPNADFAKERVLIQKSPEFFQRFYHTDPIDSLSTFFNRSAHRAEWARRMGDNNEVWASLKEKMIAEGNAAAVPQLVDLVAKSAGIAPVAVSNTTRAVVGWTKTWGSLATMPLAWLSSISETAMPAVRAGRPLQVVGDIGKLGASIAGGLKKEKALGSDLGLIANGYGDTLLGQRFGLDGAGKVRTWLHNAFFKATLLEGLTHNQLAVAVNSAQTFVRRLGLDVSANAERAVLSKKLLAELGVSDHAGFSEWVARQSEGRPTVADTRDGSAHAQAYRTAIIRFANQTIQRPNAQTFTRFSQHPVGGLIQQLQSFNYAFTNNVLARLKNLAVESIRPGSGLNGVERLAAWGPIVAMLPLMGIASAVSEGRDQLFKKPGSQPMTDSERALRVVSRSGLTGTLDPYINLVTSARYRSEAATALGGPVVGKILHDGVDAVRGMLPKSAGGPNTPNTNSAERQLAQSTYDLIVSPLVTAATLPLPAAVRTPIIQGLKLGEVRGGAVDSMAGPKRVPPNHIPTPPKPAKPASPAKH